MAPSENLSLLHGKDSIVNNLFGKNKEVLSSPSKKIKDQSVKLIW
jgi:hypothetical protein